LTKIPITKTSTIPHKVEGIYGACNVIIRPSPVGSGVIAGSSTRTLLEVVGIRNVVAKQIGSKNSLNNARATLVALQGLKNISETAEDRDVTVESLY
jgi:small subunit ribosomal protein S5